MRTKSWDDPGARGTHETDETTSLRPGLARRRLTRRARLWRRRPELRGAARPHARPGDPAPDAPLLRSRHEPDADLQQLLVLQPARGRRLRPLLARPRCGEPARRVRRICAAQLSAYEPKEGTHATSNHP